MAMRSRTSNWYECKVKYQKTMEDGAEKVVSEQYVVDALSFTEAESVMLEEMSAYVSGSITITGIVKASYGEVFFSDNDLQFITIDEKTEKEKRSNVNYLVQANSLPRCVRYVDEVMGGTMVDYAIASVAETHILDVYEHRVTSGKGQEEKNDRPEYEQVAE